MTYTRAGLIARNDSEFAELLTLLDGVTPARLDEAFAPGSRDRNVRDVVAHLYAWHLLLEKWYAAGAIGEMPAIPADGYGWRDLDRLNEDLRQQWQDTSLTELMPLLRASHEALQAMVALHDDRELDDSEAFAWTQGSSLGELALECGGNHYAWARTTIARGLRLPATL